jgi:hypothetical protein
MIESQTQQLSDNVQPPRQDETEILILHDRLLSIGGRNLVHPLGGDADMPAVISKGALMPGTVQYKRMRTSACHRNVAKLWLQVPCRLSAIGTGYALSDDGLWRQHSWGIKRDGTLVETTVVRVHYFGLQLRDRAAGLFAEQNKPRD